MDHSALEDKARRIAEKEASTQDATNRVTSILFIACMIALFIGVDLFRWLFFGGPLSFKSIGYSLLTVFILWVISAVSIENNSRAIERSIRLIRIELKLDEVLERQKEISKKLDSSRNSEQHSVMRKLNEMDNRYKAMSGMIEDVRFYQIHALNKDS